MSDILFCIHTSGSDDLIPVHSMAEAVHASAFLNAEYLAMHTAITDNNLTPYCFSSPQVWGGSAESHAEFLQDIKNRCNNKAPHWMCA